ncbi:hypothetical protein [Nostoc sp. FACHB-888]|uniref:hypothetical protein n=1 Tax=Nostoc sp. FACHB-888 TaxID=2692842 RepID=UPI0016895CDF|nr:hypothetical protein [Nostoc sp. FACHB-888]MBD2248436.1 hypothetical protein [Nostoc sp. FACHB-888]
MTTKSKQSAGSKFNRPHMIIPEEDTTWAVNQKPCVLRFWQQCWLADPYGSRWMKLVTNLSDSAFRLGRRVLEAASLFVFRRISIGSDGRTSVWYVKNLHGAQVKDFWQIEKAENRSEVSPQVEQFSKKNKANTASNKADNISIQANTASEKASTRTQTQSEQEFHQVSGTAQEHITNSFDEFVMCVSDPLTGNLRVEETAHAPLGGASPQSVQGVEELEKDLPVAMDCTSLTLVDAAPSQFTSLLAEKQNCNVEAIFPHEGTCSAAPIAQNEKSLNSAMPAAGVAIANQPHGQVKQGNSASLKTKNSVSGVEIKADHEGESSTASVPNPEKWSHEAIVARSNMRPVRREKLNRAANSGENPGFDFLQECWNDDPALQIVIKKLLAKFPQWGVAIVDRVLMKWER